MMMGMELSLLLVATVATAAAALLIVATKHLHQRWTADFEASGVQKQHKGSPPRVGGLALGVGALVAVVVVDQASAPGTAEAASLFGSLLLCSGPAVLSGLADDLFKGVRARWRLLGAAVATLLAVLVLGAVVPSVGLPALDVAVQWLPVGLALTLLLVVGFTHAMNIVDGLNGLSSGLALLMLCTTAYVAYGVGDAALAQVCLALAAVVLGFVVVNFPRGPLFLGDGGAYFLGFSMAVVWVLLLVRNPGEVSPLFCIAVAFHPTMETIFSIIRRKLRRRQRDATAPDRLHLHSLVYRRKARLALSRFPWAESWVANALASLMVLTMAAAPTLLAALYPARASWQLGVVVLFAVLYFISFKRLVGFGSFRVAAGAQASAASSTLQEGRL
jgi:UDP-GlcNAc:undecaprenyl-phosphate/decaprenyl-phosphate GlcNAc-1-phosphate transferase